MLRLWVRSEFRRAKVLCASAVSVRCNGACSNASATEWVRPSGAATGLKAFNSLTKQKEPLILAREGVATWYGTWVNDESTQHVELPYLICVVLQV